MDRKIISTILLAIIALGGMLMLTSCQTQPQNFTLNLITTPLVTDGDTAPYTYTVAWDSTTFETPPEIFSPSLARTSLVLSSAAYQYECALDNLDILGFTHKAKFNYSDSYDENAVGLIIAEKQVADKTVVAVIMRGTYAKEWYSNFDIGHDIATTKVHNGFNNATEFALDKINVYLSNYGVDRDNVKFLITGHSRGAAVANLTAKSLIDKYGKENIYAYTFATPNTTTSDNASSTLYNGIFNFVNPEDFVAAIPPQSWGFKKYGTTIHFPTPDTDENYEEKLSKIAQYYEQYKGRAYVSYGGTDKLNAFLDTATTLAPTVKDYYDTKYDIAGLRLSLHDYMTIVADILNEENMISNGLIMLSVEGSKFEPIQNYILEGIDLTATTNINYEQALLSYSHPTETYLAMLDVYIEYM